MLQSLESAREPGGGRRFALFDLGFRTMYFVAAVFGSISIAAWAAQFTGALPYAVYPSPFWHAHEMVFGFALAVIVGFLFTAGHNWTRQPTPSGWSLAAIAALWIAARALAATPWRNTAAFFDVLFALAAAAGLWGALWRARNSRNYFFAGLLVAMAALNAAFYLALAGRIDVDLARVLRMALDVVLFICVVMAGRVVPMFTNNAIPGAGATRQPWIERLAPISVLALLACDAFAAPGALVAVVAIAGAVVNLARLLLWHPLKTRARPILWILHAAHAWIPIHLALRAASGMDVVPSTLATHALGVGVAGGLIIGMITRTSRGHSGRPLLAGRAEVLAYTLVMVAALARVGIPLFAPEWTIAAIVIAAACWSAAFAVYAIAYWPILSRA
jgi:uncharacterized protein involved in response to NO